MTATGLGYQRFSTRGVAATQRTGLWEDHNARTLVSLTARTLDDDPLDASELNLVLPSLTFARVRANAHVVERTSRHIASAAVDGVALYFSLDGDAFFYHRDGVHIQRPGTLLVCDVNQPFMRGFAHGLDEYVLTVPRSIFEAATERHLPDSPITFTFADVPGGDVHAAALARLVQDSLATLEADSLAATEQSAIELLRSLFDDNAASSSAARRRAALVWIGRNLRDPTISAAAVAKAVGISERHLSRAFIETGTGVARTILEMRLRLAHRILTTPGSPTVHDVALYCGFVSAAHFSRVFREFYEQSPAEARAFASRT